MTKQFVTQFGEKIDFVEGYRAAHKRPWSFTVNAPRADENSKIGFSELYSNALDYGITADFMTRQDLWDKTYNRSLDIGGSVGVFSRFLRANGKVRHATVSDIKDGSGRFSWSRYFLFWFKYKLEVLASHFLPRSVGVLRKNCNKFGYGMSLRSAMWQMGLWRLPKLDDYVAGDFAKFDPREKFDLIVSVNAIPYFDVEWLFGKLRDITTDDATVCIFSDYSWYPVYASAIYGDFPYAAQRLTRADLERYFRENYSDKVDAMLRSYDFYHSGQRPTINNLIVAARKCGFSLVGTERLMPKQWSRDDRSPFVPAQLPLDEVLRDIQKFRSDVTLEDLHTSHFLLAFKRDAAKGTIQSQQRAL